MKNEKEKNQNNSINPTDMEAYQFFDDFLVRNLIDKDFVLNLDPVYSGGESPLLVLNMDFIFGIKLLIIT